MIAHRLAKLERRAPPEEMPDIVIRIEEPDGTKSLHEAFVWQKQSRTYQHIETKEALEAKYGDRY
ncbi:hypothetical protein [Asticcacaulis sp.]|uniref:hypothetical protein n=1 Tax=Asticcacaulis sp. TaxID=1872648 RepID=UPI0031D48E53